MSPLRRPRRGRNGRALLVGCALLFATTTVAQTEPRVLGVPAADVADAAVSTWSTRERTDAVDLAQMDVASLCEALPSWVASPPPPEGLVVVVGDRVERPTNDPRTKRFTYAASLPDGRLEIVEVVTSRASDEEPWAVERVGLDRPAPRGRPWTASPWVQGGFVALSLVVLVGACVPRSFVRRSLRHAVSTLRAHGRTVAWTFGVGGLVVVAGLRVGAGLPEACSLAVADVLGSTLDDIGALDALSSGNVVRLASTIFHQNFVVVTVSVLFTLAAALGVPAYLFAAASFFVQSVAFGTLGLGSGSELPWVVLLLVIEFTAYFSVVAGGGMVVASFVGGGWAGLVRGFRRLIAMLPWAAAWLLVGAWYEAAWLLLATSP